MVIGLGVLGSPWGWVRCPDDLCFLGRLAQEDRLTTGFAGDVFVFLVFFSVFDDFSPRAGRARVLPRLQSAGHLLQGAFPIILSIIFRVFLA